MTLTEKAADGLDASPPETTPAARDGAAHRRGPGVAEPETPTGRGSSLGPRQRSALISWAAFCVTFAAVRAVAYAVKKDAVPTGNIHAGGVHLHHYLWGITLLAASGGVAVHGSDRLRANPAVAAGYGAGAALVVDEFALLVHLKDVYWTKSGRMSVFLGGGLIAAVGASFAFIPPWRHHKQPRAATALAVR